MRTPLIIATLLLAGCQSIGMPDLSDIAAPFRSDVADIQDRPKLATAPVRPTDDRSAAEWDLAAKTLMAERDSLSPPPANVTKTQAEIDAEIASLQAEARAYVADDPK